MSKQPEWTAHWRSLKVMRVEGVDSSGNWLWRVFIDKEVPKKPGSNLDDKDKDE